MTTLSKYRFSKYHGLGNDFLVTLDPAPLDGALAARACDRHLGVGADGLVQGGVAPSGSGARLVFTLWNADGSEAQTSGNGLRCLAHAALDAGLIALGEAVPVLTPAGERTVEVTRRDGPAAVWARVAMGQAKVVSPGAPDAGPTEGPCNVDQGQLGVDLGNPHLVVLGPDPALLDLAALGSRLSDGDRRNVELVALGPGPDEITMRVWERGVGETQACGSGSCAAAVALHHWGRVGRCVTVHQPGGALEVALGADGSVTLAGPSVGVASVDWVGP